MREDWLKYLAAVAKVVAAAVLLGEAFSGVDALLGWAGMPATGLWLIAAPAIVHVTIIAACYRAACYRAGTIAGRQQILWLVASGPGWLLLAAVGCLLTAILVPVANLDPTISLIPPHSIRPDLSWWFATVFLAPVLEEFVYRGIFSASFRRQYGNIVGSYFAAVLFAWVHTRPTVATVFAGNAGHIPPGPLLLALVADWLYVKSGSIWVAVAFHAACNATPAVFAAIDPRWLNWLGMLYQ